MGQLADYEYTYLGESTSEYNFPNLDPTHYNLGCVSCHGGLPEVISNSIKKTDKIIAMHIQIWSQTQV